MSIKRHRATSGVFTDSDLYMAIINRDIKTIKQVLFISKFNKNIIQKALYNAANIKALEIIEILLEYIMGYDAFKYAMSTSNNELLKYLLEISRIDEISQDRKNNIFHIAIVNNNIEGMKILIKSKWNIDNRAAYKYAVSTSNNELLEYLLLFSRIDEIENDLHSEIIFTAIVNDNITTMKMLIENGWDINGYNKYSWTPLINAIHFSNVDMVDLLIEHGANVNLVRGKTTALKEAVHCNNIDMVERLLNVGCNFDKFTMPNSQALETALQFGKRSHIVNLLLCHGADINHKFKKGKTMLMNAIENANSYDNVICALTRLLELGTDVNIQANNGWTALMYACKHKHKKIVKYLLKNKAYSDIKNNKGQTCWDLTKSLSILKYKNNPKYKDLICV